jgi:hypothetical protein
MAKQEHRDYHRKNYHRIRNIYIELLGGACKKCDSTQVLQFDHIDPSNKSYNISELVTKKQETVLAELAKCQLLCKVCHAKKTAAENSGYTHGTTYAWMRKKCTCDTCALAKRKWNDQRNANRRSTTGSRGPYEKNPDHGTTKRYYRGCRCQDCRAANAKRERIRRSKLS